MSARDEILKKLRSLDLDEVESPVLDDASRIRYDDPLTQFQRMLESVGGNLVRCRRDQIRARVEELAPFRSAKKTCSMLDGFRGNVELTSIEDPHDLHDVDFFIGGGSLAVAENGAVWVPVENSKLRAAYFITQHLALAVPAAAIVHNLHEAYARLEFPATRYGVFISGPSKTADIEQSLVIGAHGPRSLTVLVIDD